TEIYTLSLHDALPILRRAVELLAPALGDHADGTAGVAAVLGLIVGGQHAHFGDGIHGRLVMGGPIRSGIQVHDSIHLEIDPGFAAAIDRHALESVALAGGVAARQICIPEVDA